MGAVNRCWKCGNAFAAPPVIDEPPPAPVPAVPSAGAPDTPAARAHQPLAGAASLADSPARPASATARPAQARPAQYPSHVANVAGALTSLFLALLSVALLFKFPTGAVLVSLIGLGVAVWGMQSRRRKLAQVAAVICCLALLLGSYRAVYQFYVYSTGRSPFAPNDVVQPSPDEGGEVDPYADPTQLP